MIRLLLDQLLLFAVGSATVAVVALFSRRPKHWVFYVFVKLGVLITNGILLAVLLPHSEEIPLTWTTAGYMAGLALTSIGLVGVSRDIIGKAASRSAFGDPKGTVGVLQIDEGEHDTTEDA